MEHYGIVRKKDENGIYESISKMHSWNCKSGPILAKLERHSDHHMHGYRPFQMLQKLEKEPTIPYDIYQVFNLTIFPVWWFDQINPLVDELYDYQNGIYRSEPIKVSKISFYKTQLLW